MSEQAKHTPGPWRAVRGTDLVFLSVVNVAHIGAENGDAYGAPFVIQAAPDTLGNRAYDALLVAAAPDLLVASRLAYEVLSSPDIYTIKPVGVARTMLLDAIAKAEGPRS